MRIFHRVLRVRQRIKSFYDLLVKDSLNREDVEELEEQKTKNFHEVQDDNKSPKNTIKKYFQIGPADVLVRPSYPVVFLPQVPGPVVLVLLHVGRLHLCVVL